MNTSQPEPEGAAEEREVEHRMIRQVLRQHAQEYRRRHYEALQALDARRFELGTDYGSLAWVWALRLRRLRHELIGGTWAQRRQFLQALGRRLAGRAAPSADRGRDLECADEAGDFIERATACPSEWVAVLFSGSSYVEEPLAHAFTHLAAALRRRGVPVFFSCYPETPGAPAPPQADPLLVQCPIEHAGSALPALSRADFGGKRCAFLIGFPHLLALRWVGQLSSLGWITHYHCIDEWTEFARLGMARWHHDGVEQAMAGSCDVVTGSAAALVERVNGLGRRQDAHLVRNAPAERFLSADLAGRVAPREGEPVVGYFGHLASQWFDWEALQEAARREPGWRFEIIGYGLSEEAALPPNVHLLGRRDHDEIERIAARWRAAIIPFKAGRLSDGVDPIKVYEYLALGLPVVSFEMAQVKGYPYVFRAAGVEEFVERLREAMTMPLDRGVMDAFLAENRWERRADLVLRLWEEAAERPHALRGLSEQEGAP